MNIRESISIVEANIETPSLESIAAQIEALKEQAVTVATGQVKQHLAALNKLVPGHKFSLSMGMGSTSVHINPPIEEESEDGQHFHRYDIVSPSEMGYFEHDYIGDFVPQMAHIIKQIFEIAEYMDDTFDSDLGEVK